MSDLKNYRLLSTTERIVRDCYEDKDNNIHAISTDSILVLRQFSFNPEGPTPQTASVKMMRLTEVEALRLAATIEMIFGGKLK